MFNARLKGNGTLMKSIGESSGAFSAQEIKALARRMNNIFGYGYARDIARSVRLSIHPDIPAMIFDEDGTLQYPRWDKEIAAGVFDLKANISNSKEEYLRRFKGMSGISTMRKGYLERFLDEAGRDGVAVSLWITPIHPEVARYLKNETRYDQLVTDTRTYVSDPQARFSCATHDFSDPAHFGWGRMAGTMEAI